MSRQMNRDEWRKYCEDVAEGKYVPGRCELEDCPYKDAVTWHWLDCLDCEHWKEAENEQETG